MPNRLAAATSPYLLQHQNNPVDWYPWSDEALSRAQEEGKPIFLSIGYSACHWCHVMERESFENESLASVMNEHFINIKVDREERPDLDHIYMQAIQMMTRSGGWPMSVFLTPDLQPFYGGTYWPPQRRMGMPGFDEVLNGVLEAWRNRKDQAIQQAIQITATLQKNTLFGSEASPLNNVVFPAASEALQKNFDSEHGGFGDAPKFPHPMGLRLLMRIRSDPQSIEAGMVKATLNKMSRGGIYDHLGGGFARYSVDRFWLVPHFEKMLYDNALLMEAYAEASQCFDDPNYAFVAKDIARYLLRDMRDELGGFYSTEDADSEGVEGKFYVWTPDEIEAVLGDDAELFCRVYDITERGNFEGKNIPNLKKSLAEVARENQLDKEELERQLDSARKRLFDEREKRIHPGKDDKILANWNGLAIQALARTGMATADETLVSAACDAARFIQQALQENGRLLHTWRQGLAKVPAFLDDYAYLTQAFVTLYEATFDESWLVAAKDLADIMLRHFHDDAEGGFFYTADDHEQLITRTKEIQDASVPSSNGMAATALTRLGKLLGDATMLDAARRTVENSTGLINRAPSAAGQLLLAADLWLQETSEWVLVGDLERHADLLQTIRYAFLPCVVLAGRNPQSDSASPLLDELFRDRIAVDGDITLYCCQGYTCAAPIVGADAIRRFAEAGRS